MTIFWKGVLFNRISDTVNLIAFLTLYYSAALNFTEALKWLLLAFCFAISLKRFLDSKAQLKAALYYVRIKQTISKTIKFFVFLIIILGLLFFANYYFKLPPPHHITFYLAVLSSSFLGNQYAVFLASVRAFEQGLKLPGKYKLFIAWNKIKALKIEGNELTIDNGSLVKYEINKKDFEDAENIIDMWNKNMNIGIENF